MKHHVSSRHKSGTVVFTVSLATAILCFAFVMTVMTGCSGRDVDTVVPMMDLNATATPTQTPTQTATPEPTPTPDGLEFDEFSEDDERLRDPKAGAPGDPLTSDGYGIYDWSGSAELRLQNVPFNYDSAELTAGARRLCRDNAERIKNNETLRIIIEGHCDERGTTQYNLALGQERARSIYEYFLILGVEADRLETLSYGEELPIDPRLTEEAFAHNRMARFSVRPQ